MPARKMSPPFPTSYWVTGRIAPYVQCRSRGIARGSTVRGRGLPRSLPHYPGLRHPAANDIVDIPLCWHEWLCFAGQEGNNRQALSTAGWSCLCAVTLEMEWLLCKTKAMPIPHGDTTKTCLKFSINGRDPGTVNRVPARAFSWAGRTFADLVI